MGAGEPRRSSVRRTSACENAKRSWSPWDSLEHEPGGERLVECGGEVLPCRSLTCSSGASSNSVPMTAASVRRRTQASPSRASRRLTTSRTASGTSARASERTPSPSSRCRTISCTKNVLPAASSRIACTSSAGRSSPVRLCESWATSASRRPESTMRSSRCCCASRCSASASAPACAASAGRCVASTSRRMPGATRARSAAASRWTGRPSAGRRARAGRVHPRTARRAARRRRRTADSACSPRGRDRAAARRVGARQGRSAPGRPARRHAARSSSGGDGEVVPERLDEVLVGDQQVLVGRAVQHDRSVLCCLEGELACQPALADPGLADEERDARAVSCADVATKARAASPAHACGRRTRPAPAGGAAGGSGKAAPGVQPTLAGAAAVRRPGRPSRSAARRDVVTDAEHKLARLLGGRDPELASEPIAQPRVGERAPRDGRPRRPGGRSTPAGRPRPGDRAPPACAHAAIALARSPRASACAAMRSSSSDEQARDARRGTRRPIPRRGPRAARLGTARAPRRVARARGVLAERGSVDPQPRASSPTRSRVASSARRLAPSERRGRPDRVAQARAGAGVQHLGPEAGGDVGSLVAAGVEREPGEQRTRTP